MLRDLFSLFPAYAGVIPVAPALAGVAVTFPRIRGGDPAAKYLDKARRLFSPHTRG